MSARHKMPRLTGSRRTRIVVLLFVLCVLITVAWLLIDHFLINIDRFRPQVVARLERYTGLSAGISALDLDILPWPQLDVLGASMSHGDASVTVRTIHVEPDLWSLLHGQVQIDRVRVDGLRITLPDDPDELKTIKDTVRENLQAARKGGSGRQVEIKRVVARNAEVFWRGEDRYARADVVVTNATSDRAQVTVKGTLDGLGADATADVSLYVYPHATPRVTGQAELAGLNFRDLTGESDAPEGTLSAVASIDVEDNGDSDVGVHGVFQSESPMAGDFAGAAHYADGALQVKDVTWTGKGLHASGTFARAADGTMTAHVDQADADSGGLASLIALAPLKAVQATVAPDGSARLENLALAYAPGGTLQFQSGSASVSGITLATEDGVTLVAGLSGKGTVSDGRLQIDELSGKGLSVHGAIGAAEQANAFSINLAGTADLAQVGLLALIPKAPLQDVQGTVTLDTLTATLHSGGGIPPDLQVQGRLADGQATLATDHFTTNLTQCTADFSTNGSVVHTSISAQSPDLGPLAFNGQYDPASHQLSGNTTLVTGKVVGAFMDADRRKSVAPLLGAYGAATYTLTAELPTGDTPAVVIKAASQGPPDLHGTVTIRKADAGWTVDAADAATEVPTEAVAPAVSPYLTATGAMPVTLKKAAGEDQFTVNIDASPVAVTIGDTIEKEAGLKATLKVTGQTGAVWTAQHIDADLLGQSVQATFVENGFQVQPFTLDLAPLSPILPQDAHFGGTLSGSGASSPPKLDLSFDHASLYFSPDEGFDSITGGVNYHDGVLAIDNLSISGANSSAVLNATTQHGAWNGSFTGDKLDVNAVMDLVHAAQDLASVGRENGEPTTPAASSATGSLDVRFGTVYWRRAQVDRVAFTAVQDASGLHFRNLSVATGDGSGTGTIDMVPTQDQPHRRFRGNFNFDKFDMTTLDGLLFPEPRGMKGTLSGTISCDFPLLPGKEAAAQANGSADLTAHDGSFGKLGFASKLLSVLRTTEVLQLKLPTLKDEGLVFDKYRLKVAMQQGVLTISEAKLISSVYAVEAEGNLNFAQETSNVLLRVDLAEPVSKLAGKVPVVGSAVKTVMKTTRMRVKATGSPYDLKVYPDPASRLEGITNILGGSSGQETGGAESQAPPDAGQPPGESASKDETAPAAPSSESGLENKLKSLGSGAIKDITVKPLEKVLGK